MRGYWPERITSSYELLKKAGEGAYGDVTEAIDR
jgi:hypothetical protein